MNNYIINTSVLGCNCKIENLVLLGDKRKIELKKNVYPLLIIRPARAHDTSNNHSVEMSRIVNGERCATANYGSTPEQTAVPWLRLVLITRAQPITRF